MHHKAQVRRGGRWRRYWGGRWWGERIVRLRGCWVVARGLCLAGRNSAQVRSRWLHRFMVIVSKTLSEAETSISRNCIYWWLKRSCAPRNNSGRWAEPKRQSARAV